MSSYLSNLLTQTTSRYNSLRRTLLSSEEDGDTEDDTHLCRVLRAYYNEKGRAYPQWLPPDPNDRRSSASQASGQSSGYFTSAGGKSQYAAVQSQGGQRGSLNDLWDTPGSQNTGPLQPQSLRGARRPVNPPSAASAPLMAPPSQGRPLPSQRAGSYQSVSSQQGMSRPSSALDSQQGPAASAGGGMAAGSAQERLKARLWGGGGRPGGPAGSGAPPNQGGAPNTYGQPPMNSNAPRNPDGNAYDGGGGARRYGR